MPFSQEAFQDQNPNLEIMVGEVNDFLPHFPPAVAGGVVMTKFSDDKLSEIIHHVFPDKWHVQMSLEDFDPSAHTLKELLDFCEKMEACKAAKNRKVTNQR